MLNLCIFAFYTELRHRVGIHNDGGEPMLITAVYLEDNRPKIYQNFNLRLTEQTMKHS